MPYSKSIEEIASQAVLDAMDTGARTPQEVYDAVIDQVMDSFEVGGVYYEQVIDAYQYEGDNPYRDVEYQWPTGGGTLVEALINHAAYYIAEVAKRIMQEESSHTPADPGLEDYPLR